MSIALREDDVVDSCRIDLRALDQRLQDDGAEFAGAHRRQAAAELADGGADRGDDGGAAQGHFGSPVTIGNGLNRHPGLDPGSRSATVKAGPRIKSGVTGRGGHLIQHRRSEEHTYELQSLLRISYDVFCLKK